MDNLKSTLEKIKTLDIRDKMKEMIELFKGEKPSFTAEEHLVYKSLILEIIGDVKIKIKKLKSDSTILFTLAFKLFSLYVNMPSII